MAESKPKVDDWDPNLNRVPDRLQAFRNKCSVQDGWGVVSELLQYQCNSPETTFCIFRVSIIDPDGRRIGVGHARSRPGDGRFNEKSLLEVCETKALGRALAACGLHGKEYASEFEIESVKPPKSDSHTNSAPAVGAKRETTTEKPAEKPAEEPAKKALPKKQAVKKGTKKKVAKKKAPAKKAEAEEVDTDALATAIMEATNPEELTVAFNTARLNAAEFDDWSEVSALATDSFKAINAAYLERGEAVPANDGEWSDFIDAMKADKAAMRACARAIEHRADMRAEARGYGQQQQVAEPPRRLSIAEQYTRRVDHGEDRGFPMLGEIS